MIITRLLLCFTLISGSVEAQHLTTAAERYFNIIRRNLETSADSMPA